LPYFEKTTLNGIVNPAKTDYIDSLTIKEEV
jgi:hypothetical protein